MTRYPLFMSSRLRLLRSASQLNSNILVAPLTPVICDFMPDNNLRPGRVQ
jgi:hypothetical protein